MSKRSEMAKIEFTLGDPATEAENKSVCPIIVTIYIKKTWLNRFRFWLFFKFSPFCFSRWIE
ncbi:hypothetical protein KKF61_08295 [Patescibacteria group bacterium]|nr:hypothetical protein [Patescibacteria group bacterium]